MLITLNMLFILPSRAVRKCQIASKFRMDKESKVWEWNDSTYNTLIFQNKAFQL